MSHKILFVDDEPNVTNALKHTLRKERYDILTADSAKEALEILARHRVDVVVSDEQMPGMSGSKLLTRVRKEYPEIIRIVLTGEASAEAATRAINEGEIYRFLIKPCNGLDLLITIRRAIEHKKLVAKSRQLLKSARQRTAFLQKIEEKHLSILKEVRKNTDINSINEPEVDSDTLIEAIDTEVENSEQMFMDWI